MNRLYIAVFEREPFNITSAISSYNARCCICIYLVSDDTQESESVSGMKEWYGNISNFNSTDEIFTKDPEGVVGLDLQGGRVTEGTQKVQEVLKGQTVP